MSSLNEIQIKNYRSIHELTFSCEALMDESRTYGLIGLNEAGKSSILKSIALMGVDGTVNAKDFHDKKMPISLDFIYSVNDEEIREIQVLLNMDTNSFSVHKQNTVKLRCEFEPTTHAKTLRIGLFDKVENEFVYTNVYALPSSILHLPIFWAAKDNYIISLPIDLTSFSASPSEVSVPLRNCFRLAGITDIATRISELDGDATEMDKLQRDLGKKVTEHIKTVWPNHPVDITFLINDNKINFLIRDDGSERAKTVDQRSDGFKQFISFLLTVSAENQNEELNKSILLLDEPETHLHPLAQEYLLNELIKITKNDRENIALFATHSNYMIDKLDLSRNFRVQKEGAITSIMTFDRKISTYASVGYEVFSVLSRDYHTELYGRLHDIYQDQDIKDDKRCSQKNFDEAIFHGQLKLPKDKPLKGKQSQITLPTYIRNCIHHPENGAKFTDEELEKSIEKIKIALKMQHFSQNSNT